MRLVFVFFFKQKTAYEMRISDWSSDVCSSDLWDQLLIRRGLKALARAEALGGADGPYALQAALAACHARARRAEEPDWRSIAALYDRLGPVMPSPVVELNSEVAHRMAFGPEAGLALIDTIAGEAAHRNYAPLDRQSNRLHTR